MNCLLDTHTFLWAAMYPEKLRRQARVTILDAANDIHVSVVTFWEVSLKYALGKIELQGITPGRIARCRNTNGLYSPCSGTSRRRYLLSITEIPAQRPV